MQRGAQCGSGGVSTQTKAFIFGGKTMPSPALNSFFEKYVDNFVEPIYDSIYRYDPYAPLIKREKWNYEMGENQTVVRTSAELPTGYDFNLSAIPTSTGTVSACDITTAEIKSGHSLRSFALRGAAFRSEWLCLRDLKTKWAAIKAVQNYESALKQFATVWWSDFRRKRFIEMLDGKISTTGAAAITETENSDADFSALAASLPTALLNWDIISQLSETLLRKGAGVNSVGFAEGGKPVFMLTCGWGLKRSLWLNNLVRETVNYAKPFENLKFRGYGGAIDGVLPNVDNQIMRFDEDLNPIYPTVNVAASNGMKWQLNPAYKTVANNGDAVYEVAYLTVGNVYEEHVPGVEPKAYSKAKFDGVNSYSGEIQWLNNPDNDVNPLGENGYYRMEMQVAAKPTHPDNGYAILTLAKD
jgi:hypothetical protein